MPSSLTGLMVALAAAAGGCDSQGPDPIVPGNPPTQATGARLQEIASGLSMPLFLTAPTGDLDRLFVVEKPGRIRIIKNGALLPTPFLDISGKVANGGEQGLLGLAFHPGYATNGRFVVNYTNTSGDTRVAVYRLSADPDRADAASEEVILAVDQPFSNHNGGMVVFGPDGKLFIGLGDGGSGGDPQGHGQNRNSLLGKILRLDLSATGPATVPADNPFVGQQGTRPEIWSLGLRNPWRFSFDRSTGDLYIADVGQNAREEVNVSTSQQQRGRGANYGWSIMEGTACFSGTGCSMNGLILPAAEYGHSDGCSVTGGYVYRGATTTNYSGHYFYGDYCGGWIRSFRYTGSSAGDHREWTSLDTGSQLLSFGEDARGEMYVLTSAGKVLRIEPVP